jgi:hypothetical protein
VTTADGCAHLQIIIKKLNSKNRTVIKNLGGKTVLNNLYSISLNHYNKHPYENTQNYSLLYYNSSIV